MNDRSHRPENLEEIHQRLAQPRPFLSPSKFTEAAFEAFQEKNDVARGETSVMSKPLRIITGESDIPSEQDVPFRNLADLTDGSLTKATPDFYDGCHPSDIGPKVREELDSDILPSANKSAPCLPNFFAEGKGPTGSAAVCKRQACYDGALGARAIHALRSHVDPETALDYNAYTITSTYHGGSGGGQLKLYTTHPYAASNASLPIQYWMTQLGGWDMTGDPGTFRRGAGALRNARDWVKEQREDLIAARTVRPVNGDLSTSELPSQSTPSQLILTQQDSDTSADELNAEVSIGTCSDNPSTRQDHHQVRHSSSRRCGKEALRAHRSGKRSRR